MHPRIAAAVRDVEATFGVDNVTATELPDNSVWLAVAGVDFGAGWSPRLGELAVKLAPTFPDTGPYPWYMPSGIHRDDDEPVDRISPVDIDGKPRSQLSLNGPWSAGDSLGARMLAVLQWLHGRGQRKAS